MSRKQCPVKLLMFFLVFWKLKKKEGAEMLGQCRTLKQTRLIVSFFFHGHHSSLDCVQLRAKLEWSPLTWEQPLSWLPQPSPRFLPHTAFAHLLVWRSHQTPRMQRRTRPRGGGRDPRRWSPADSGSQIYCLQICTAPKFSFTSVIWHLTMGQYCLFPQAGCEIRGTCLNLALRWYWIHGGHGASHCWNSDPYGGDC